MKFVYLHFAVIIIALVLVIVFVFFISIRKLSEAGPGECDDVVRAA